MQEANAPGVSPGTASGASSGVFPGQDTEWLDTFVCHKLDDFKGLLHQAHPLHATTHPDAEAK
jgi:hypothetical protein